MPYRKNLLSQRHHTQQKSPARPTLHDKHVPKSLFLYHHLLHYQKLHLSGSFFRKQQSLFTLDGTQSSITVIISVPILSQINLTHNLTFSFLKIHFYFILSPVPRPSKMSSCVSFLAPILYAFLIHSIHASSLIRFILKIFGGVKLMKLLIIHFLPNLCNTLHHHLHHH